MWSYILKRILYAIPILVCVNVFTFFLFFFVNSPEDVAKLVLGEKVTNPEAVFNWKREHEYHLPKVLNLQDKILYISTKKKKNNRFQKTQKALSGYEIELVNIALSAKMNKDGFDENDSLLRDAAKKIDGDNIIIIDSDALQKKHAMQIKKYFLEKAAPIFVLEDNNGHGKRLFTETVINHKNIKDLRKVIDKLQVSFIGIFTETMFYKKSVRLFWFNFGTSDREGVDITYEIKNRMWPSLMITLPAFALGIFLNIFISMMVAYCRDTYVDRVTLFSCIAMMSIVVLFYILGAQLFFANWLKIFPMSGYQPGIDAIRFVMMAIIIMIIDGFGPGVRFYRTIFLEEMNQDYIRTARAKGLKEFTVLYKHVLKNCMLPILTNSVVLIPTLFIGSLVLERAFAIPGLGGFTLDGIQGQDFRIVGSMVYLGAFLYIIGLIITDISYTIFDPRIKLK